MTLEAILGAAAAGALVLVAAVILLLLKFCISKRRNIARNSDTDSSDPSVQATGRNVAVELLVQEAKCFSIEELSLATRNFSEISLIGVGKFGQVYKGLLQDGMLVAVRKRAGAPSQDFINKARYLCSIHHPNLMSLTGFCQEHNLQFLVYEYVSSGSIASRLYGADQTSEEKLDFKHRLSIALGAAKGLAHLHSLRPRLIHRDFRTCNVFVDENFIAKIADAGLFHFLKKPEVPEPSSEIAQDAIFLAPEARDVSRISEKSDTYSFGVFLLELVSGREATENILKWVRNGEEMMNQDVSGIIDQRLGNSFSEEAMEEVFGLAATCVDVLTERRLVMRDVVMKLEHILEKEVNLTRIAEHGTTPVVTLGSQLFQATL